MGIELSTVTYRDREAVLEGLLVADPALPRRLGVLLIHGGAGLDVHARQQARRIAGLGYVVFACDMYGVGVAGDRACVLEVIGELTGSRDQMCRRAGAGLEVLAEHPRVNGRLAAVGYCFGGTAALALARCGTDLAGVASIHGGLRTGEPAGAGRVRARILISHGSADPHVPPADVAAFTTEMLAAGADWQLHVHPGARHGFTHANAAAGGTAGVAFDARADARSLAVLGAFLAELGSSDR